MYLLDVRGSAAPGLARVFGARFQVGPAVRVLAVRPMTVRLVPLDGIERRRPRWLWRGYVPLGNLTLLAGVGGLGKSLLSIDLAAQATRGELEGDLHGERVPVVVASSEDTLADVIAPRFDAAGGDPRLVRFVSVTAPSPIEGDEPVEVGLTLPEDVSDLSAAIEDVGARMLVLDPLVAHMSERLDSHRDHEVRRMLSPLFRLAEHGALGVVGVVHLNKAPSTDLYSRINGSSGYFNAARSVLLVAPDPDDDEARVLAQGKANLSRVGTSLRFNVEEAQTGHFDPDDGLAILAPRVRMLGPSDRTADDLLVTDHRSDPRAHATRWLVSRLRAGPVPVATLSGEVEAEDRLSWATVRRAADEVGVVKDKLGFSAGWEWRLPREDEVG